MISVITKLLGVVPAIVKLVRSLSRRGPGAGHYYQATHWDDEGRTLQRSPCCYFCGRVDYARTKHTEPPCPGKVGPWTTSASNQ